MIGVRILDAFSWTSSKHLLVQPSLTFEGLDALVLKTSQVTQESSELFCIIQIIWLVLKEAQAFVR